MIQNILITSAGRRVSLVKNFQESLKSFNPEAKVLTTDMHPELSSASQVSDGFLKVPRVTDATYINILKEYCLKNSVSLIIPTIDTELHILAKVKEEFLESGISIAISSLEICETFYLKDSTEKFFLKHGLDTPRSVNDIEVCSYPIFAKLNNSSCSIGAQVVESLEVAKELALDANYVFQEYIEGREFTVDTFVDKKGEAIAIVPRERLEVRAGEVSKARAIKDERIISAIKSLVSKLQGAYGCLTIQLFLTQERITFIEINPRFGGGYPLSAHAGANFAEYQIRDFLGEELSYSESWRDNTLMLRYDAEVIV